MTPNPFLEDLILMIPPECLEDQESARNPPGCAEVEPQLQASEPSAAIRTNTELLPHLEPSIRPHAQFIDAALSYYHGTGADRDVRDAWARITDRLTQLRLERDHARAISAWQPIETAPKDGTRIITWQPDTKAAYGEAIQHWDDDVREDQRGRCDGGWSDDEGYWTARPPTHWRPLPSPPGEAASPIGGQVQALDEPEISWKSRTQKAEAALAEAVGVLKFYTVAQNWSHWIGSSNYPDQSEVMKDRGSRAASFLSLLGEAGREEVRGASVADSGGTASPKSESSEGH